MSEDDCIIFHLQIDASSSTAIAVHMFYIFYAASFLFSIFGLFGICKKKTWALIVVGTKQNFPHFIKEEYLSMLPLANATESAKDHLDHLQNYECCGIQQGYTEWMEDIPRSCLCIVESTYPCVSSGDKQTNKCS
uniref:Uncharacterized protein n=1 Tax=Oryzias sinensis TaxID=183150 RepID=A0A8C8DPK9_9TELE